MNIVLLDDNYVIRFVLKKLLPKVLPGSKFNIYSSNNGVEGLGYIFLTRPHLVIVDTTLPKYDGLEVIDYIKNNNHLNNTNVPILILHEGDTFDGPFPGKFVVNKSRPDFIEKLIEAVTLRLNLHKSESDFIFKLQKRLGQNVIHYANMSDHVLFTISDKKPSRITGIILTLKSFFFQILSSFYLTLFFIISGKKDIEQNIEQKSRDKFHFRVRFFPAFGAILATILFACFQFTTVFSIPGIFFFSQTTKVEAVTRTWDGGGVDNNWSTCANWSGNICPTSVDDVVFNATSTKDATINAGFTGTVNSVSINAGYTGIITQARNLVVTAAFTQSAGTFTGSANTLDINGALTINTGVTFTASTTMTVAGSMTINAGSTFNNNSGTITFDGTTTGTLSCGSKVFNLIVFTGTNTKTVNSDCTLPLGNNPSVASPISLSGTLSGTGTMSSTAAITINSSGVFSGFTGFTNSGTASLTVNGTLDFSTYTTVDMNGTPAASFVVATGANFTAPTGTMSLWGFSYTGGTFNANGGTMVFDRTSSTGTINCFLSPAFNNVVFSNSTSITINSNCTNVPIGASPTLPGPLSIAGTLVGTGTITFNGAISLQSNLPISGFTGAIWNSTIHVQANNPDFSALTTFDSNSSSSSAITVTTGTFIAPTGNMTHAGGILIQSTGNWNANGGTLTLDSTSGIMNLSCLAGSETFNVIFAHIGNYDISSACIVNVGNDPIIPNPLWIRGSLIGTGTLTMNESSGIAGYQYNTTTGISGFDGFVFNGSLFGIYSGSHLDLSSYTVVDINEDFRVYDGGTFTAPSGTMTVNASEFTLYASSTFNHNSGTIEIDGGTGGNFTCSNKTLNSVVINNSALKIINSCTLPLASNVTIPGEIYFISSTVNASGTFTASQDLTINSSTFPLTTNIVANGNTSITATNLSNLSGLDFNGDLTLVGGSGVTPPSINVYVSGDLIATSTNSLNHNNSTFVLDGTGQEVNANATFYNLYKVAPSADTLYFNSARRFTVLNNLTLQGTPGNILSLRSTTPGTKAGFIPVGARNVSYLDVQDSANLSPVDIEAFGLNISDSGNNSGWDFLNSNPNLTSLNGYTVSQFDDQIRLINLLTGTTTSSTSITLAGFTVTGANGLSYDPYTCNLYAILKLQGQSGRQLVTINPATGVATSIGDTGRNFANIAFDYYGNLWGITGDGDPTNPETLYTIDITNGSITLQHAFSNGWDGGEAIGYNSNNGLLYHATGGAGGIFESVNLSGFGTSNIPINNSTATFSEAGGLLYSPAETEFILVSYDDLLRITTSGELNSILPLDHDAKAVELTTCTQLVPPDDPSSIGPSGLSDGSSTDDTTPTLTFDLTDSNTGELIRYNIQIDNNSDFSSPEVDFTSALGSQGTFSFTVGQALNGGTYTVGTVGQELQIGEYYWRVLSIDSVGQQSNFVTANSGNVAFVVIAIDSIEIEVSSQTATVGQSLTLTVTAKRADDSVETGYTGTVTFSSTDSSAVLPANYTFSASDSGEHSFLNQLAFNTAGNYTVTVTDTDNNALTSTSSEVVVTEPAAGEEPVEENCAVNAQTANCQQSVRISNIQVTRNAETGSIEICWDTNLETRGSVEYGLASEGIYSQSSPLTEEYSTHHCVTINGLVAGIEYIFRIHSVSYAGKEEIYTYDTEPGNVSCIEETEEGVSFNNNEEAIVSYETIASARCTLVYTINETENMSSETPLSTEHESTVDFSEADGVSDINYQINCDIENEKFNIKCDLPGVITAAEYRNFLKPEEPVNSETFFDVLVRILTEIAKNILPITLVTGLVIATAATIASDPRMIFNGYAWLKLRKKSHPWGIVYDLLTSKPVSFATVRLYDKEGKFIKEDITGLDGKYGFTAKEGSYKIEINHSDYELIKQSLKIDDSRSLITKDFGLSSKSDFVTKLRLKIKKNLGKINSIIFLGGFVLSVIATIFAFTPVNLGLTLLYGSNILVLRAFRTNFKPGGVVDSKTNLPIKGAFVRIYDQREKRQTDVQITDEIGSYGFKLEPGSYLVNVYAPGYELDTAKFSNDEIKELEGQKLVETRVGENQNLNIKFSMNKVSENTTSNPFG